MHAKHPGIAARWDAEIRAKKKGKLVPVVPGLDDVAKSFVRGGFYPAAVIRRDVLREAIRPGMYASKGPTEAMREHVAAAPSRKVALSSGMPVASSKGRLHKMARADLGPHINGVTVGYGGKRGVTLSTVNDTLASHHQELQATVSHEMAHAIPRRSAWRMSQITRDPVKLAREEARATRAEKVSKMGPDASAVHVTTALSRQKAPMRLRLGKLKPIGDHRG